AHDRGNRGAGAGPEIAERRHGDEAVRVADTIAVGRAEQRPLDHRPPHARSEEDDEGGGRPRLAALPSEPEDHYRADREQGQPEASQLLPGRRAGRRAFEKPPDERLEAV